MKHLQNHITSRYMASKESYGKYCCCCCCCCCCRYLHEVCSPSIVHKNIKSANILLDSELNPHLSDSGLASFLPTANEVYPTALFSSSPNLSLLSPLLMILIMFVQLLNQNDEGYSAPEVSMSGQYSLKSDVYSFGVVMLELLTGRKPFDRYCCYDLYLSGKMWKCYC